MPWQQQQLLGAYAGVSLSVRHCTPAVQLCGYSHDIHCLQHSQLVITITGLIEG
jgi:hypothetical protein